jgi:hypothetical protein
MYVNGEAGIMAVQLYNIPNTTINILPQRFERKHYVLPRDIGLAIGLLRQVCLPASEYPSEQINSLYFDTHNLDQHERSESGDFCKDKVRIRWYGAGLDQKEENQLDMQPIYIELKSRRGFAGTKQRLKSYVLGENLAANHLSEGIVPMTLLTSTLARFGYFLEERLLPIIKISYWRYRFSEILTGQRVSVDCHIRSTMILPGPWNGEKELELPGGVIEIKGSSMELPEALRQLRILELDWARFSKYSACIDSHSASPGSVGRLSPAGRIVDNLF